MPAFASWAWMSCPVWIASWVLPVFRVKLKLVAVAFALAGSGLSKIFCEESNAQLADVYAFLFKVLAIPYRESGKALP